MQLQNSPQAGDAAPDFVAPSTSGKEVSQFYSNRAYFLIDREGTVTWSHVEANPGQRRENSEFLAAIELLS